MTKPAIHLEALTDRLMRLQHLAHEERWATVIGDVPRSARDARRARAYLASDKVLRRAGRYFRRLYDTGWLTREERYALAALFANAAEDARDEEGAWSLWNADRNAHVRELRAVWRWIALRAHWRHWRARHQQSVPLTEINTIYFGEDEEVTYGVA